MAFLKETPDGKFSTMRLISVILTVIPVLGVVVVWTTLSIRSGEMIEIPTQVLTLLGILVGSGISGKVLQKNVETRADTSGLVAKLLDREADLSAALTELDLSRDRTEGEE